MPFRKEGGSRATGSVRAAATNPLAMTSTGAHLPRIDLSCLASDTVLKQAVPLLGFRFAD